MRGVFGEGFSGNFKDENCEGLERRRGEEMRRERSFGGREEMSEAFEDGHLVNELVNVRDIGGSGETDTGE